ncbi:MAG: Fic family protein [Chitinophagaceae bacterium]|nr:Fic family protein [Chitinophagaceae bacterium]
MRQTIEILPLKKDVETKPVLRKAASARGALAELKGIITSIPNENILLETLALREARESSAIENIISTFAEVYQSNLFASQFASPAAKEVHQYAQALRTGFGLVKKHGLLTNNFILQMHEIIEQNNAGFRKLPGTKLLNDKTGAIIYTPPQDHKTITRLMNNLEQFINDDKMMDADPLIKMAIIHHQFETIHPFYDGNGRTGRIISILYLVQKGLLHLPVLYLSRYIIRHKNDYYRLLQKVRETGKWEEWILYMLDGVEQTATESVKLIGNIKKLMQEYKQTIRTELPKLYSQDLLNNLFKYPYTKIEFLERDLEVSGRTATRYLEALIEKGLVKKQRVGRDNFYLNESLFQLLSGN